MGEISLEELQKQIIDLQNENKKMQKEIEQCREETKRADDYRQIMNAMAAHVYGYYGQQQPEELEKYWAKAPDIAYAHGEMCYFGQEGVHGYYEETTKRLHKAQREIAKNVYGIELEANEVPGYKVMHVLGSPFIEIAKDRKTAQGIFMDVYAQTRMNLQGKEQDTAASMGIYAADFINENGVWKLWHRVDFQGFGTQVFGKPEGVTPIEESFDDFKKAFPVMPPTKAAYDACNLRTIDVGFDERKQYPFVVSRPVPRMPEPYETWNDEQSYARIIKDTFDGGIPMQFDEDNEKN